MPGPSHKFLPKKPIGRGACRAGFTLVEVALAALVIGLGILTLFGLARIGAQSAAEAEDETRAAMFAENVFGVLDAFNNALNQAHEVSSWPDSWKAFQAGEEAYVLDDAALGHWLFTEPDEAPALYGDGRTHTNFYASVSGRESNTQGIPETRIVYRLSVNLTSSSASLAPENSRAAVTLNVWPTRSVRVRLDATAGNLIESYTFYRHFLHHGPLP